MVPSTSSMATNMAKSTKGDQAKGVLLAVLTAIVSGFSVFINSFGVKTFDPFAYTIAKNAVAALLVLGAALLFAGAGQFRRLALKNLGQIAFVGVFGGGIPFLMFFYGLSIGNASTGAFIYRMLFAFTAVFAVAILRERIERRYFAGALLAISGCLMLWLMAGKGEAQFGLGETLVLGATVMWAVEWTLTKRFLEEIEPGVLAFGRLAGGVIFMVAALAAVGRLELDYTAQELQWSAMTGVLLFVFTWCWYNGLKHASASTATAILALGGPVTAGLNLLFLGKAPGIFEVIGLALLAIGIVAIAGIDNISGAFSYARKKALAGR